MLLIPEAAGVLANTPHCATGFPLPRQAPVSAERNDFSFEMHDSFSQRQAPQLE